MNPLLHKYAYTQGRVLPTGWVPADGEYVFVLGDESCGNYLYTFDDHVEIKQDLDLDGFKFLRVDSRIVQPTMPAARNIAVDGEGVHIATLQYGHILQSLDLRTNAEASSVHPGSETGLKEPYSIIADSVLRIEVDGGGDVDIAFPSSPPVLTLTAAEVVTVINAALTSGGVAAVAQVGHDVYDPTVIITANSTGNTATFEVKDYPGPEDDANDRLGFFQKVARPLATDTKIYGGDTLSAIIAPNANFTIADVGQPVIVTGATPGSGNNVTNHIISVLNASRAVLKIPVADEAAGFDAAIVACLWELSLHVDGTQVLARQVESNRTVDTNDIAANVSKLTGTHEVLFRLQLRSAA